MTFLLEHLVEPAWNWHLEEVLANDNNISCKPQNKQEMQKLPTIKINSAWKKKNVDHISVNLRQFTKMNRLLVASNIQFFTKQSFLTLRCIAEESALWVLHLFTSSFTFLISYFCWSTKCSPAFWCKPHQFVLIRTYLTNWMILCGISHLHK